MATMKLRVRAASGGPTIRVQVPLFCTLQGLKDMLGPLTSLPVSSFSLSLNKKDEIQGPGSALLSSFGVTSGDLLFYIPYSGPSSLLQGLNGNSPSQVAGSTTPREPTGVAQSTGSSIRDLEASPSHRGRASESNLSKRELCAAAAARRAEAASLAAEQHGEICAVTSDSTSVGQQTVGTSDSTVSPRDPISPSSSKPTTTVEEGPLMGSEIDERRESEMLPTVGHRLVPIPDLLQRVLTTEFQNIRQPPMCLVLAVHAVMLETGFLRVETGNNSIRVGSSALEGYDLPSGWSDAGLVNLTYTLPELTRSGTSRDLGHEALLRCQIVGNAVVVYGAVTGGSVHRVSLSASRFLQKNLILQPHISKFVVDKASSSSGGGNTPDKESIMEDGHLVAAASMGDNIFHDIFELWKEVKDFLSLPLLTFLCEKTGLPPPPSLLRLPTELKLKVLDSLPSVALANLACSCSEFRFLASNDELWKQKYQEEFGAVGNTAHGGRGWRSAFVREFERRQRREVQRREAERLFRAELVDPGDFYQLRPPSFAPSFGDLWLGLGRPAQHNIPGDMRIQNISGDVEGNGAFGFGGGVPLPRFNFDGGDRAWPPVDSLRSRGVRLDADLPRRPFLLGGRRDFGGDGPPS